jgi:DNA-binding transcriptional MerR regulator
MQIGELAQRSGVSTRSLRYYESQGLLESQRQSNGYREYGEDSIAVVRKISGLIRSGVSSEMIGMILPCMPESTMQIEMCDEVAAGLARVREHLDKQIETLESSRESVTRLLESNARATA